MMNQLLEAPIVHALGWALLHCLWQGTLLAMLLALLLIVMRDFSSHTRYIVIGICLACFVAILPANIIHEYKTVSDNPSVAGYEGQADPQSREISMASTTEIAENADWLFTLKVYFQKHAPLIGVIYLMGLSVLILRFLGQLAYVHRLKVHKIISFPQLWIERAESLEARLGITKKIKYLESVRIQTPMTIGWIKPVILFPAGLVTRLSPESIEAILLHELAHIKRNDFLFNVLQSLAVILFFFHPAVYWISKVLNEEREHACDDLVVNLTGDNIKYAGTLVHLQEYKLNALRPANYFLGGTLKSRIGRLLSDPSSLANNFREGFVTALVLMLGICFIMAVSMKGKSSEMPSSAIKYSEPKDIINRSGEVQPSVNIKLPEISDATHRTASAQRDHSSQDNMSDLITNAIEDKNMKLFEVLLSQIGDVDKMNSMGMTPLSVAAKNGQLTFVQRLLEKGARINFPANDRNTPLLMAADKGHLDIVKHLILKNAALDAKWKNKSALTIAAEEGHLELLRMLTAYFPAKDQGQLLLRLAKEGDLPAIKVLLNAGVPPGFINDKGETALSMATQEGQTEVVRYLLSLPLNKAN